MFLLKATWKCLSICINVNLWRHIGVHGCIVLKSSWIPEGAKYRSGLKNAYLLLKWQMKIWGDCCSVLSAAELSFLVCGAYTPLLTSPASPHAILSTYFLPQRLVQLPVVLPPECHLNRTRLCKYIRILLLTMMYLIIVWSIESHYYILLSP